MFAEAGVLNNYLLINLHLQNKCTLCVALFALCKLVCQETLLLTIRTKLLQSKWQRCHFDIKESINGIQFLKINTFVVFSIKMLKHVFVQLNN